MFLFPIVVFLGPAFIYLRAAGELLDYGEIIRRNQDEGALVGMAYSNPIHTLKSRIVVRRKPEVIALGTSRVMQVRDYFFTEPKTFYNCGGSIHKIGDLTAFLNSIEGSTPKVLILCLDQNFFNEGWDDLKGGHIDYAWLGRSLGRKFTICSRDFYKDVSRKKISLKSLTISRADHVGLTGNIHLEGYREDGSYRYRRSFAFPTQSPEARLRPAVELVRAGGGDGRFMQAESINDLAVEELDRFLMECKHLGIHVVSFLPPYAHIVYEELVKFRTHYPYILQLESELRPTFTKHGYRLFDFTDLNSFGGSDAEMQDSIHGFETALLRILIELNRGDPLLKRYADVMKLDSMLEEAYSPSWIFEGY